MASRVVGPVLRPAGGRCPVSVSDSTTPSPAAPPRIPPLTYDLDVPPEPEPFIPPASFGADHAPLAPPAGTPGPPTAAPEAPVGSAGPDGSAGPAGPYEPTESAGPYEPTGF